MTSGCNRVDDLVRGTAETDAMHVKECRDCRDAQMVQRFLRRLALADDLSPALPDPRILLLKAELVRGQAELRAEDDPTRWAGVGVWAAVAATWLVVLTWKLGDIQSLLAKFDLLPALPGGAAATALLIAAIGGLVAFTVFAVAVHSILAEL